MSTVIQAKNQWENWIRDEQRDSHSYLLSKSLKAQNVVDEMKRCSFSPKINKSSPYKNKVLANSNRLFQEAETAAKKREELRDSDAQGLFKPIVNRFIPSTSRAVSNLPEKNKNHLTPLSSVRRSASKPILRNKSMTERVAYNKSSLSAEKRGPGQFNPSAKIKLGPIPSSRSSALIDSTFREVPEEQSSYIANINKTPRSIR